MMYAKRISDGYDLCSVMADYGRDYFSMDGYCWLYDLLDECGVEEVDPIAITCDFTEESLEDFYSNYGYMMDDDETKEYFETYTDKNVGSSTINHIRNYLEDFVNEHSIGTVLKDSIIYQNF